MKVLTTFIKQKVVFILTIVVSLIVGGVFSNLVKAAIPDTEGVIHACYRSSGMLANGQTRIIDSSTQTCHNNETAITWSQTAPTLLENSFDPAVDSGVGQNILTIPGFGNFSVEACNSQNIDGLNGYWRFTNTSGTDVLYFENGLTVLHNNDHIRSTGAPSLISLRKNIGSTSKIVNITMVGHYSEAERCRYHAQALFQP